MRGSTYFLRRKAGKSDARKKPKILKCHHSIYTHEVPLKHMGKMCKFLLPYSTWKKLAHIRSVEWQWMPKLLQFLAYTIFFRVAGCRKKTPSRPHGRRYFLRELTFSQRAIRYQKCSRRDSLEVKMALDVNHAFIINLKTHIHMRLYCRIFYED